MNQTERRIFLIKELLREQPKYADMQIPVNADGQKRLLRSLFNIRMPEPVSEEFLQMQDAYLQEETARKGITSLEDLTPEKDNFYLWQGDITTLQCDAIVNAANARLLGCFCPCHGCIDNAIHTFAGVQLRLACADIMLEQRHEETFENEAVIRQMMERQTAMRIPAELLPVCPHCGRPLTMNLRSDNKFVEDKGWHLAAERYETFLRTRKNQKILFLELGASYNTPGIIKYPFWQMTAENPKAAYACINYGEAGCPREIEGQSICVNGDIGWVLQQIRN